MTRMTIRPMVSSGTGQDVGVNPALATIGQVRCGQAMTLVL